VYFQDGSVTEVSSMKDYASCESIDSISTLTEEKTVDTNRPISMASSIGPVFKETEEAIKETEDIIKDSYDAAYKVLGTTG